MKVKTLMVIAAVLSVVFGLGFLIYPHTLMTTYGFKLDITGDWLTRFIAPGFVGIGVLNWLGRNLKGDGLRAILYSDVVFSVIGFLVTLIAHLSGLGNVFVWVTIIIYFLLTFGFVYFAITQAGKA